MTATIYQFVPKPNPNRDKALIDQTNMEQMAVNVLHQALGYPDAQQRSLLPIFIDGNDKLHYGPSGIDGPWPEKDGA